VASPMQATAYPHIELTPEGTPVISGTTTKVIEVALDRLAYHWDADEIRRQHPHLSLAQIHSALAYYYDHQEAMDQQIAKDLRDAGDIEARIGPLADSLRLKLRSRQP